MSEGEGRKSGGVPRWVILGGLMLGLLLAGNLAVAMWAWPEDGDPQGFLTPALLRGVGLWSAIGLIGAASAYGLFCVEKLKDRREVRGVGWMRGAFSFGLIAVTGLAIATFEPETFRREDLILLALWVYAVQMLLASRLAAHQAGRATSAPRKRKRKHKTAPHSAAPAATELPADAGSGTP